ncbi:MAG: YbaB/EbfC family nucleoid-associated protein [Spirochaetaceae bacterium]|jgi:DNA-binding YbaB/EbfC family protein|nr:YbaB/EbfC family nucleoid-associated protein [Spirochaetaceae bacterium]
MNINPFDILKNAQKIQEQMGVFQEKLGRISATGSAGGGMVEVDLNGRMEVMAVRIAAEIVDPREIEVLQDLITAAFANALEKIKEGINQEMGAMAGGFGLTGMPGFPGFPGAGFPEIK